ncbi:hypothetical protein B0T11DRAFT_327086 [Plectosphaerella cucumerina]|uniref:C2H2-type domain-containing protein n=1 Tax=Plectosphaerella cucumerina TaxID=40658 RepID=A0A8K0TPD9_9PEZI|nr:hypothetical protein B0T11DRAFT_327086 [Plectosphaerella cucumerina]
MADLSESISGLFVECLSSFGSLIIALSNERCRAVHLEQVVPVQMFEEYGRFKIWGDQTKAELPPLARATDIASRTIDPGAGSDHDSISSVSADSESEDEAATQSRRMPQICLLVQQITGQVRALHDLSSLLRRPNVTDKYIRSVQTKMRAAGPLTEQVLDFSSADLCHVQEKVLQWRGLTKSSRESQFDNEAVAPVEGQPTQQHGIEDLSWFCIRLATANIRRREQLGYWVEHPYERDFSKPLLVVEAPVLETRTEASRSQASTIKAPVQVQSVTSDWSKTHTSKMSFSTAAVSDLVDGGSIARPRTVRHVFRDLRPYVCTFEGCQTAGKMYVSRHEWVYHEMQTHRREYVCKECDQVLSSRAEMTEHIRGHREEPVKPGQLSVMLDLCSRQIDTLDPRKEPCLICGQEMSLPELQTHLATHMESLAIFVLPSTVEDDGSKGSAASVRMANVESTGERGDAMSTKSSLGFSDGGEPHLTAVEFERLLLAASTATIALEIPGSDPSKDPSAEPDPLRQREGIVEEDFGYVTSEELQTLDTKHRRISQHRKNIRKKSPRNL